LKIGIYGFGGIGRLIAKYAVKRGYEIVGIVDIDESIIGRDIGELIGLNEKYGVKVSKQLDNLVNAEVVFHATRSYLNQVYPELVELSKMSLNIISTCETLVYPYYRYPTLARNLDMIARKYSSTILGSGVNPGFIMDTLIVILSSSIPIVKRVVAKRSLDAGRRRLSFIKKIGVNEDPVIVKEKLLKGVITGHVGYAESVFLIAEAMNINLTRVIEGQDVIVAEEDVESSGVSVAKGRCKGIRGYGVGYVGDEPVINIELEAYVGAEDYEEIVIEGDEYVVKWRSNGTPGDQATVAILLNLASKIHLYGPGLITMNDILPFTPHHIYSNRY